MSAIHNTLTYLRQCQHARQIGYPVTFTTDPAWLVNMAINRRAGWPDDTSLTRGSAMPVRGQYPKKADGDRYRHLTQLVYRINSRSRVCKSELGELRTWLVRRLPERFADRWDD